MTDIESKLETINSLLAEIKSELKPRRYISRSVDGVNLYSGDMASWVIVKDSEPEYLYDVTLCDKHSDLDFEGTYKLFSNKEAADKWVSEQIEPKETTIAHFAYSFIISKGSIQIYHGDSDLTLSELDINEIYQTYKSLNPSI